jgi:hypothetical protein
LPPKGRSVKTSARMKERVRGMAWAPVERHHAGAERSKANSCLMACKGSGMENKSLSFVHRPW